MSKGAIRSIVGLAVLAAVLVVGAGCGGSDSGEELTKADFVRKGNAICGKWQQARTDLFREINARFKPPITQAKKEKAVLEVVEPYEDAIKGLKELDPPSGEEAKVETMITAAEEGLKQAHANPQSLLTSGAIFAKSNQLFKEYGLKECSV